MHVTIDYTYTLAYLPVLLLGNISELQRVSKLFLINRLSPVMILQLKRFSIGSYTVAKDTDDVSFPMVLNMAPYCTSECVQVYYVAASTYTERTTLCTWMCFNSENFI